MFGRNFYGCMTIDVKNLACVVPAFILFSESSEIRNIYYSIYYFNYWPLIYWH